MKENKLLLRFALLFLFAGNIWDLLMTVYGLQKNIAGELNPLLGFLHSQYGIYYLIISKISIIIIVGILVSFGFRCSVKRLMFARCVDLIFLSFAGGIAFFCAGTSWLFWGFIMPDKDTKIKQIVYTVRYNELIPIILAGEVTGISKRPKMTRVIFADDSSYVLPNSQIFKSELDAINYVINYNCSVCEELIRITKDLQLRVRVLNKRKDKVDKR